MELYSLNICCLSLVRLSMYSQWEITSKFIQVASCMIFSLRLHVFLEKPEFYFCGYIILVFCLTFLWRVNFICFNALFVENDARCVKEATLHKRVGFYRFRGELGNGNFSHVKIAVNSLTKGQWSQRPTQVFQLIIAVVNIAVLLVETKVNDILNKVLTYYIMLIQDSFEV